MIVVTGGAGFIGSNLVRALNDQGRDDVVVVDNLTDGKKFMNLVDCQVADYYDKEQFHSMLLDAKPLPFEVDSVVHLGACSATTEWNGRYIMENNYRYSRDLLNFCEQQGAAFQYASSASVYGDGTQFIEDPSVESPLNVYGYSKFLFDQHVRRVLPNAQIQIIGLRYFNVYGPREQHKGDMSSVASHFRDQLLQKQNLKLFEGCDGYANGEQQRDFIYVEDAINAKLWFMQHPDVSGIFNIGTGRCQSFNDVANAVINYFGSGEIEYIPFPEHLKGRYQSYTQADLARLRASGCDIDFRSVEQGVSDYMTWLDQ